MPTTRRRHAITETPPVQAALDELRGAQGEDRVDVAELVILGARVKADRLRTSAAARAGLRRRIAERVRTRDVPVDQAAADEVRRHGWTLDGGPAGIVQGDTRAVAASLADWIAETEARSTFANAPRRPSSSDLVLDDRRDHVPGASRR